VETSRCLWVNPGVCPASFTIAQPLTDLTKQGVTNVLTSHWTGDCQEVYEQLWSELVSSLVLRITPYQCLVNMA